MIPAALYHRVSTLDQDAALAREELHGAARSRGFEIALDIEETGSGARNDRPGLLRVLDAARRGQLDAVLVWKLDRFGRSALDLLANIRVLEDAGVRFVATTQGIDIRPGGDPMSRLILTVLAGVAEFERGLIVERTRLGLDKARRLGRKLGRPVRVLPGSATDAIRAARVVGESWRSIAARLGISVGSARRAVERAENGSARAAAERSEIP